MHVRIHTILGGAALVASALAATAGLDATPESTPPPQVSAAQPIDLAARLAAGTLRATNRDAAPLAERAGAVTVDARAGNGVIWIEGSDFGLGTLEVDVRGRDLPQQSFVGIAFHRRDDDAYEAVYLRPFNFRNADTARRQNAVQYIAVPDYDWPRLRKEFPSEFENPVDASIEPTGWVPLRLVVTAKAVQVFVGTVTSPTLEVRTLGAHDRGMIGLWTGNGSDGAFANLRITPVK